MATPGSPAAAAPTTGTITGHVRLGGALVAEVTVDVEGEPEPFFFSTETDASGAFVVPDVPEGTHLVHFVKIGLADEWAFQRPSRETADLITVTAGATTVVDEDLRSPGTLRGRITDAHGTPIFAEVEVHQVGVGLASAGFAFDGAFQLSVPPGRYQVLFLAVGLRQWVPRRLAQGGARVFEVRSDQAIEVTEALLPTGSLSGRLVTAGGQPVAEASVQVRSEVTHEDLHAGTDDHGVFRIAWVFAGQYKVFFGTPNGFGQAAHRKRSAETADVITVRADVTTTVDERLFPTGTVAGRFLGPTGVGVEGIVAQIAGASVRTDPSGRFRIEDVPIGRYAVTFEIPGNLPRLQYAFGKLSEEAADMITVTAGRTTVVNERQLPVGTVRITAHDARTGAPVAEFCVDLSGGPTPASQCAFSGEAVLEELTAGRYQARVTPAAGGTLLPGDVSITVVPGDHQVAVPLRVGGEITSVIRDAATGQPVAGACLVAVPGLFAIPTAAHLACSDATGALRLRPMPPDKYRLLALPAVLGAYGMQWVGPHSGTGNRLLAAPIEVRAGHTSPAPTVRLDPPGVVTGLVTDAATGSPQRNVIVTPFGVGPLQFVTSSDRGRYVLRDLGPYDWPLFLAGETLPWQWSGGTLHRFLATTVRVRAGTQVTFDPVLRAGTTVTGTVRDHEGVPVFRGSVVPYDAITGEAIGLGLVVDGRYSMQVLGPRLIKLRHGLGAGPWYDNAVDFAHATLVLVPSSGTKTVNIRGSAD